MTYLSAKLFAWLQSAEFYENFHTEAMRELPEGKGEKWIDIGCGPGLLTRLASAKGYNATGIDGDKFMIREAMKIAKKSKSSAFFACGDLYDIPSHSADIVSASSLIAMLDDKTGGFRALLNIVKPGGSLIILEPTNLLTPNAVDTWIKKGMRGKRIFALRLWAHARKNLATNPMIYNSPDIEQIVFSPLYGGLVGMWIIQKKQTRYPVSSILPSHPM